MSSGSVGTVKDFLGDKFLGKIAAGPAVLSANSNDHFGRLRSLLTLRPARLFMRLLNAASRRVFTSCRTVGAFSTGRQLSVGVPIARTNLRAVGGIGRSSPRETVLKALVCSTSRKVLTTTTKYSCLTPCIGEVLGGTVSPFGTVHSVQAFVSTENCGAGVVTTDFGGSRRIVSSLRSNTRATAVPPSILGGVVGGSLTLRTLRIFRTSKRTLLTTCNR